MSDTLDQKIAESKARTARLKAKRRDLEKRENILFGTMAINAALTDPWFRTWLLEEAGRSITREADRALIEPFLVQLRSMPLPTSPILGATPTRRRPSPTSAGRWVAGRYLPVQGLTR